MQVGVLQVMILITVSRRSWFRWLSVVTSVVLSSVVWRWCYEAVCEMCEMQGGAWVTERRWRVVTLVTLSHSLHQPINSPHQPRHTVITTVSCHKLTFSYALVRDIISEAFYIISPMSKVAHTTQINEFVCNICIFTINDAFSAINNQKVQFLVTCSIIKMHFQARIQNLNSSYLQIP